MASGDLETAWFNGGSPSPIGTVSAGEIRIRDRNLIVARWESGEEVCVGDKGLFGEFGPEQALVLRALSRPNEVLAVGEEGTELLRLDLGPGLERPLVARVADMPRDPNDVGGMCFLTVLFPGPVTLIHWELGVLALDRDLELRWRQDLQWNHEIIHLDDAKIDYLYDSGVERIGVEPYGFCVVTGRQLFDRRPPDAQMAQKPFWGGRAQP